MKKNMHSMFTTRLYLEYFFSASTECFKKGGNEVYQDLLSVVSEIVRKMTWPRPKSLANEGCNVV